MFRRGFLPSVGNLLAFEATARHGSVSRAAEELNLTQSAVSRQIQQLEDALGVSLFSRTRQRVVLTDVGRMYATHVRNTLAELSDATRQAIALSGTSGVLNLAVLPTFGTRWLIPRMREFLDLHPDVTVNFGVRLVPFDFAAEPFDAAIHFGQPHWPGALCDHLLDEECVPVCSPDYRERENIRSPADLARATLLQQSTRSTAWAEWSAGAGVDIGNALRGPRFEQFAMVAQAAVAGLGVGLIPHFLIADEIASGRLTILFSQSLISSGAYYLVYPEPKAEAPLVRSFRDWIRAKARQASAPHGTATAAWAAAGLR
ncbi:LysR family transcriptional regulator [Microvirga thermotolerans]|uniref:Transcriptional regulator GcvA n=1 Tax=Microvirga thermotolerans TaxID=2651334 RepID=A0A5P9JVT9_9HYPH|nr:LysR family transcriptional regulator [Microvirga thermotolerans]QFU15305.1 transcriptional regulator GcvA [Microvirga thermotolerans]